MPPPLLPAQRSNPKIQSQFPQLQGSSGPWRIKLHLSPSGQGIEQIMARTNGTRVCVWYVSCRVLYLRFRRFFLSLDLCNNRMQKAYTRPTSLLICMFFMSNYNTLK